MIPGSKPDFCNSLFSVGFANPINHPESRQGRRSCSALAFLRREEWKNTNRERLRKY